MKLITKLMVDIYNMEKIRLDFMGYSFESSSELSYHHTIDEKEYGGLETTENGVILVRKTSHDYLHIIKDHDKDIFDKITEVLIEENRSGRIDIKYLAVINELLIQFEKIHKDDTLKNGKLLIKDIYKDRLLNYSR